MNVIETDLIGDSRQAYFIGIGGVGMSALARVLKHRGLQVSGSDRKESPTTRALAISGIPVFLGQEQIEFGNSDLIVYSSAIRPDHLELKAAREDRRKVHHRAEILSSLLNQAKTSIAITGTHGKTTTSSMISYVLARLGKKPTCLVGGDVMNLGTNTLLGDSDLWVSEVDESDQSHELYAPNYTVLTNLEEDHLDHYKDLEAIKSSFERFLSNSRNPGLLVYSDEDPVLRSLVLASGKPRTSFSFSPSSDFSAQNIEQGFYGSKFDLYEVGLFSTPMQLCVPGLHNIANALAAAAVLVQLGISPDEIRGPLSEFRGAKRRLEIKWESSDLMVVDDYAHHPTEVRASIRALRATGKRLTVVFQPHRFSRTQHFFKQFGKAFEEADELILTEIYSAGETNPEKIGIQLIYDQVATQGHPQVHVISKNEIIPHLLGRTDLSGVIAFLGAGDIGEVADEFANRFKDLATA